MSDISPLIGSAGFVPHSIEDAGHIQQSTNQQITNEVGPNLDNRQIAPDSNSPSSGARETVLTPFQQQQAMVEERLAADPEYQDAQATLAQEKGFEEDFRFVERNALWSGDGVLTLADLNAVANDVNNPAHDAANRLLQNQSILNQVLKGDDRVSSPDVTQFFQGLKTKMADTRKNVTADVKAELKASAPEAKKDGAKADGGSSTGTDKNAATGPSPEDSVTKPLPSVKDGMDGASENLANTADYLQNQMMALAEDASKHPENANINAQKIAMLQSKLQAILNMQSQLAQMLSNMSKMWSDVAMNSIRNLK